MRYVTLPDTKLRVSSISLGTAIEEAPDPPWWRAASDNDEGRPTDATLR